MLFFLAKINVGSPDALGVAKSVDSLEAGLLTSIFNPVHRKIKKNILDHYYEISHIIYSKPCVKVKIEFI
jgi:hypothetical protein